MFNIDIIVLEYIKGLFPIGFLGGYGYIVKNILLLYIASQLFAGVINIKKVRLNNNIYGKRRDNN